MKLKPSEIRYGQNSIKYRFGRGEQYKLSETMDQLLSKQVSPESIETIEVVSDNDVYYARTGNRRLFLYKILEDAGLLNDIVTHVESDDGFIDEEVLLDNGEDIKVRSEPNLEQQLKDKVKRHCRLNNVGNIKYCQKETVSSDEKDAKLDDVDDVNQVEKSNLEANKSGPESEDVNKDLPSYTKMDHVDVPSTVPVAVSICGKMVTKVSSKPTEATEDNNTEVNKLDESPSQLNESSEPDQSEASKPDVSLDATEQHGPQEANKPDELPTISKPRESPGTSQPDVPVSSEDSEASLSQSPETGKPVQLLVTDLEGQAQETGQEEEQCQLNDSEKAMQPDESLKAVPPEALEQEPEKVESDGEENQSPLPSQPDMINTTCSGVKNNTAAQQTTTDAPQDKDDMINPSIAKSEAGEPSTTTTARKTPEKRKLSDDETGDSPREDKHSKTV